MEEHWKKFKEIWANSSLAFKLIHSLSLFFTLTSVTSLSEKVIAWKGFIKDGIDFYRNTLADPITSLLQKYNFNIDQAEFDWLVITGILLSMGARFWWLPSPFITKKPAIFITATYVLIYIQLFVSSGTSTMPSSEHFPWLNFIILVYAAIVIPSLSMDNSKRVIFLSPLIVAILW